MMTRCILRPARAITLVEVVASVSIIGFAVASVFLAFSTGLRMQEETRARLLASTLAMKFFDDFANIYPGSHHIATESRSLLENGELNGNRMEAERVMTGWGSGCAEVPRTIAARLDSDEDEIGRLLRAGAKLHFLTRGFGRVTSGGSNAQAGFTEVGESRLPRETGKLVFAIVGHDQANSLFNHPLLAWPYYLNYPQPPIAYVRDLWIRENWPGRVEFERLWNFCTGTWNETDPNFCNVVAEPVNGQYYDKLNRFHPDSVALADFGGTQDEMRKQVEILNDLTQDLLAAVLPASLLDTSPLGATVKGQVDLLVPLNAAARRRNMPIVPPAMPNPDALTDGWASLTGDPAITTFPRPWQVQAISYAAWAALLRTSTVLDASPGLVPGPFSASADQESLMTELHRRSLLWACRYASTAPYDWGAPRPWNRMLGWDHPLLEWDLFPTKIRSSGAPADPTVPNFAAASAYPHHTGNATYPTSNAAAGGRDTLYFMGSATDLDRQFKVVSPVPSWLTFDPANPASASARRLSKSLDAAAWAAFTPSSLGMPQGIHNHAGPFAWATRYSAKNLPAAVRYIRDGDGSGPGTLMDSWGTNTRSTLCAPFQAAERTRELVFWYVDWQSYQDWETGTSSNADASSATISTLGDQIYRGRDGTDLSMTNPTYWDPTNSACPGYAGPRDIDQDGVSGESGPVPPSVRLRARTIARYPIYDPRLLMALRF